MGSSIHKNIARFPIASVGGQQRPQSKSGESKGKRKRQPVFRRRKDLLDKEILDALEGISFLRKKARLAEKRLRVLGGPIGWAEGELLGKQYGYDVPKPVRDRLNAMEELRSAEVGLANALSQMHDVSKKRSAPLNKLVQWLASDSRVRWRYLRRRVNTRKK